MCLSNRTHQNIYHNHTNTGLMWIKEKRKTFLNKYHKIWILYFKNYYINIIHI